jgi:DNA-binding ferritin-like protein
MSSKRKSNKHTMKKRAINNNDGAFQKKIVSTFLCMLNTVKLYHWSTVHYSTHKATDELYSGLSSKIDTFVETMFGKESIAVRQKVLQMSSIHIHSMQTNKDFKNETEQYKSFLINLTNNKTFNIQKNTDLMNMRDDILGSLNQFLYLLTLK